MGTGQFLDKPDLELKYGTKPQRLEAILKNAKTYYCEISETFFYEDMGYKSVRTDRVKAARKMETNVVAKESKLRPPKRPKTDEPKENASVDGLPCAPTNKAAPPKPEPKPLTPAQEAAITKKITDLEKFKGIFDEKTKGLSSKEDWVKYVPSYVHDKSEVARTQVDMVCPNITKASET